MAVATTAAIISAATAVVGTGYSLHQGTMAKKKAKGAAAAENKRINEASQEALGERKELIDVQRKQMGLSGGSGGSFKLNQTGATGINEGLLG